LKKHIYLISGLGADERVFQNLDLEGFDVTFLKWIVPNPDETIENYATRLLEKITHKKPILIGLSFGGIMAVEIAKQIETEKVILVSSAKNKNEIPLLYRRSGALGLHKFISLQSLKKTGSFTYRQLGVSSVTDKKIMTAMFSDTNSVFFKWAIDKIVKWENITEVQNIFHIHGSSDKILPYKYVKCDVTIDGGEHLMILTRAQEVGAEIRKYINS